MQHQHKKTTKETANTTPCILEEHMPLLSGWLADKNISMPRGVKIHLKLKKM